MGKHMNPAGASVVVSADGRRIAAISNDWEIGIWDKTTGKLILIP